MTGRAGRDHVVLVGMMGSGKSTVGAALADCLGWPLVDSDAQVEARTGHTVAQIFASQGEAAFRAEETAALHDALAGHRPSVVAAAGGSVLDPANRALIRQHALLVVWLRADPAVLAQRVASGDHRPLLADDRASTLRRLDQARRPLYEEVADVIVDVDAHRVDDTVHTILACLPERSAR